MNNGISTDETTQDQAYTKEQEAFAERVLGILRVSPNGQTVAELADAADVANESGVEEALYILYERGLAIRRTGGWYAIAASTIADRRIALLRGFVVSSFDDEEWADYEEQVTKEILADSTLRGDADALVTAGLLSAPSGTEPFYHISDEIADKLLLRALTAAVDEAMPECRSMPAKKAEQDPGDEPEDRVKVAGVMAALNREVLDLRADVARLKAAMESARSLLDTQPADRPKRKPGTTQARAFAESDLDSETRDVFLRIRSTCENGASAMGFTGSDKIRAGVLVKLGLVVKNGKKGRGSRLIAAEFAPKPGGQP